MKFTEQDQIGWESGKYNEMSNYKDYCDIYDKVIYYPELNVTVWLSCFFEGHFNDCWIEQFDKISKGKASWDKVVDYLTKTDDKDDTKSYGLNLSSILNV